MESAKSSMSKDPLVNQRWYWFGYYRGLGGIKFGFDPKRDDAEAVRYYDMGFVDGQGDSGLGLLTPKDFRYPEGY